MAIGAVEVRVVLSTIDVSDGGVTELIVLATVVSLVRVCVEAENDVDVIVAVVVSVVELPGSSDKVAFGGTVNVTVLDGIETTATSIAAHFVSWSPPS